MFDIYLYANILVSSLYSACLWGLSLFCVEEVFRVEVSILLRHEVHLLPLYL